MSTTPNPAPAATPQYVWDSTSRSGSELMLLGDSDPKIVQPTVDGMYQRLLLLAKQGFDGIAYERPDPQGIAGQRGFTMPQSCLGAAVLLAVAAKAGMGVIFVPSVSEYHTYMEPMANVDIWNFLHQQLDPSAFWPGMTSATFTLAGQTMTVTAASLIGDPRVIGWLWGGEYCCAATDGTTPGTIGYAHRQLLADDGILQFIDTLGSAPTDAWVRVYALCPLDTAVQSISIARGVALKGQGMGFGVEGYATGAMSDVDNFTALLKATGATFVGEWGTDLPSQAYNDWFVIAMFRSLKAAGVPGIFWGGCAGLQADYSLSPDQAAYGLLTATPQPGWGTTQYPAQPWVQFVPTGPNPYFNPASYIQHNEPSMATAYGPVVWGPGPLAGAVQVGLSI